MLGVGLIDATGHDGRVFSIGESAWLGDDLVGVVIH